MKIGGTGFTPKTGQSGLVAGQVPEITKKSPFRIFENLSPARLMSTFSDILDRIWLGALQLLASEHFDPTSHITRIKSDAFDRLIATLNGHQIDCRDEDGQWSKRGAGDMLRERLGDGFQFDFTDKVRSDISKELHALSFTAARSRLERTIEPYSDPRLTDSPAPQPSPITHGDFVFIERFVAAKLEKESSNQTIEKLICEAHDKILETRSAVSSALARCRGDWGPDDVRTIRVALMVLEGGPLAENPLIRTLHIRTFASADELLHP